MKDFDGNVPPQFDAVSILSVPSSWKRGTVWLGRRFYCLYSFRFMSPVEMYKDLT